MLLQDDQLEKRKTMLLKQIQSANSLAQKIRVCSKAMELMGEADDELSVLFMWFVETAIKNWERAQMMISQPSLEDLLQMDQADDDIVFPWADAQELPDADAEQAMQTLSDDPDYSVLSEEDSEVSAYLAKCQGLAKGSIDLLSNSGYTPEQYYTNLWNLLYSISHSRSELEKGALLYAVLRDNRTPYFEVKAGMRMPNEEYRRIVTELNDAVSKLKFVLNLANSQRTETASQILMILDELGGEKEKCVFLTQLIGILEWKNMQSPPFVQPLNP